MGQMTTTAIIALPLMLAMEAPWKLAAPSAAVWASMGALAVLSTALGYVVFFRILATAGATNISLVTLLIPVSAVLLGSVILGERVSTDQLAGMLLIALGLIAIDGRETCRCRLAARRRIRVRTDCPRQPSRPASDLVG
jgi:drug/metabolite transporter (DMT)-like permease